MTGPHPYDDPEIRADLESQLHKRFGPDWRTLDPDGMSDADASLWETGALLFDPVELARVRESEEAAAAGDVVTLEEMDAIMAVRRPSTDHG